MLTPAFPELDSVPSAAILSVDNVCSHVWRVLSLVQYLLAVVVALTQLGNAADTIRTPRADGRCVGFCIVRGIDRHPMSRVPASRGTCGLDGHQPPGSRDMDSSL